MTISRPLGGTVSSNVYKTEVIKNTLNPTWNAFSLSVKDLCNGDYNMPLKFTVYDKDKNGSDDLIGEFLTTFVNLRTAVAERTAFPCNNPKKQASKRGYKDSGKVFLTRLDIYTEPSFLDYVQGGTALNFSVAVDFTASNGDPNYPSSLHFR